MPERAEISNPLDLTDSAEAADYERALAAIGKDPWVDSIVAIYVPPMVTRPQDIAAGIARGAAAVPAYKPVLTVFLSETKRRPNFSRVRVVICPTIISRKMRRSHWARPRATKDGAIDRAESH